jgi:hypothetical protein
MERSLDVRSSTHATRLSLLEGRSADLSPSQSRTCGAARHPCFSCRNCETRSWTLRSTARESLQPPETLTSVASQRKHAGRVPWTTLAN